MAAMTCAEDSPQSAGRAAAREPPGSHSPSPRRGERWLPRQAVGMRRIDFHCHADTKPWIASGRSWATRTRSSSSSTRTPSVVFGACGAMRGAGKSPPPPPLRRAPPVPPARRRQRRAASRTLASSPAEATSIVSRKQRATCRRATSSASPPQRSKTRTVSSSTTLGQPAPTCSVPKLVHTSARPSSTTAAKKRVPPRLPSTPTGSRSTAAGSRPLASNVSATRRASSPKGAWRKSSGSPTRG
jgi:hypothetical protein